MATDIMRQYKAATRIRHSQSAHARRHVRAALLLLLLGSALAPALAQARDYIVEVVVFENRFGSGGGGPLSYPELAGSILLDSASASQAGFRQLDNALTLSGETETMTASGRYRILQHLAWQQPGLASKDAIAVRIGAGSPIPMFLPEDTSAYSNFIPASAGPTASRPREITSSTLNGSIKVSLGRYLHLDALLSFTDSNTRQSFRLMQSRRMRSRELHYIDNPRFGLLARITPVEEPEQASSTAAEEVEP